MTGSTGLRARHLGDRAEDIKARGEAARQLPLPAPGRKGWPVHHAFTSDTGGRRAVLGHRAPRVRSCCCVSPPSRRAPWARQGVEGHVPTHRVLTRAARTGEGTGGGEPPRGSKVYHPLRRLRQREPLYAPGQGGRPAAARSRPRAALHRLRREQLQAVCQKIIGLTAARIGDIL